MGEGGAKKARTHNFLILLPLTPRLNMKRNVQNICFAILANGRPYNYVMGRYKGVDKIVTSICLSLV